MKQAMMILIIATLIIGGGTEAHSFWGGNSAEKNSGLDFSAGYDTNTVVTVTATVLTVPARHDGSQHTGMVVATQQGTIIVLLGPWSYWEGQGFSVVRDQEISITGSKAQGKDGVTYIFAQKLENKSAGSSLSLRSDSGAPLWSRGGGTGGSGVGQNSNRGTGSGAGYRGGTMRGGGRR